MEERKRKSSKGKIMKRRKRKKRRRISGKKGRRSRTRKRRRKRRNAEKEQQEQDLQWSRGRFTAEGNTLRGRKLQQKESKSRVTHSCLLSIPRTFVLFSSHSSHSLSIFFFLGYSSIQRESLDVGSSQEIRPDINISREVNKGVGIDIPPGMTNTH